MKLQPIATENAPAAIGPYSQAVRFGNMLFCSGQIPLDPLTGEVVAGDISAQTGRVMANIAAVLKAAGAGFADVIKTTVFLVDMDDFAAMNGVYASYFENHRPARSTVAVKSLPRGVRVEIEVIAGL
ncbi:MAG: reactive intermediate/imine deaminase [Geobacteraceae bacterium GWC2_55_20]|nr:MAG: reactive intermediate/imine deaminase [Geobacteraceae bacterium GWC2_55_20]HCE66169.1 reactive intermediate/imine deaminase [Geobacter sp.]